MKLFLTASIGLLLSTSSLSQDSRAFKVHFGFDKYNLSGDAAKILDSIATLSTSFASIQLSGHCDAVGTEDYNQRLSELRVNSVKNYLLQKGIAPGLISRCCCKRRGQST